MRWFFLLLLALCANVWAKEAQDALPPLRVAAASDLRFVLPQIISVWRSEANTHAPVSVIYGSSGRLYRQIQQGAPFHVFLSADVAFPKKLQDQKIALQPLYWYAEGKLVVYARSGDSSCLVLTNLPKCPGRIVIANPTHAPYGMRAKEAMLALGVWHTLKPRMIFAENIAQAAQYAARGEVTYAVIAKSLVKSPGLAGGRWQEVPVTLHQPIKQSGVVIARPQHPQAQAFMRFLQSAKVKAILAKFGFRAIGASHRE